MPAAAPPPSAHELPSHRPIPVYATLEQVYPDTHLQQACVLPFRHRRLVSSPLDAGRALDVHAG